jgi:outer membrane murein-binding lipoprotein Lpp
LLSLVVPFSLVLGCSSDRDAIEKQLSKLREEVRQLQSDTDRMSERIDVVEAQRPAASDERVASAAPEAVTRPKLKVVRVGPDGTSASSEAAQDPEAEAGPRVLIQGEGKALETRTLPAKPPAPKPEAPAPKKP